MQKKKFMKHKGRGPHRDAHPREVFSKGYKLDVYSDMSTYCCPKHSVDLFLEDVKPYDYMKPLEYLSKKHPDVLYFKEAIQNVRAFFKRGMSKQSQRGGSEKSASASAPASASASKSILKSIQKTIQKSLSESTHMLKEFSERVGTKQRSRSLMTPLQPMTFPDLSNAPYRASPKNKPTAISRMIDEDVMEPLNSYEEQMMMYYLMSCPHMNVITIYPKATWNADTKSELLQLLSAHGNVYYIKKVSLTSKGAVNLLYAYYSQAHRMKRIGDLMYKAQRLGWDFEDEKYYHNPVSRDFYIIFYENTEPLEIRGSSTAFKSQIRDIWLSRASKAEKDGPNGTREYDFCHINDTDGEAHEYIQLLLNRRNLELLERQNIERFLYLFKSRILYNTLKNILHLYFTTEERSHFLFFSSIIFYVYGLRDMNDIDGYVYALQESNPEFYKKVIQIFTPKMVGSKYNLSIPFYGEYTPEWDKTLQNRAKKYGATSYHELVFNPKYHVTYMGLKILDMEYDILKRVERSRPPAYADLLAVKMFYPDLLKDFVLRVPKEMKYYNTRQQKDKVEKVNPKNIIASVQHHLKTRYQIILPTPAVAYLLHYYFAKPS